MVHDTVRTKSLRPKFVALRLFPEVRPEQGLTCVATDTEGGPDDGDLKPATTNGIRLHWKQTPP